MIKRISVIVASLICGSILCQNAYALPIQGTIGFTGGWSPVGSANILLATGISFANVKVDDFSQSGAYTGTDDTVVTTFGPVSLIPPSTSIDPLWSFTIGAVTYEFEATTFTVQNKYNVLNQNRIQGFTITGYGWAKITGYEDTYGNWSISGNQNEAAFNFSSTAAAPANVPDGGLTMALLGFAFLGVDVIRRKSLK